jgi:hypothetical protein
VPGQGSDPKAAVEWEEIRHQGQDGLAARAAKRLRNDMLLVTRFGGTLLWMELDWIPLWRGDHVGLKQLAEDFAQYLYLPRLKDTEVLLAAIRDGVALLTWADETFACAEGWDAATGRYKGLRAGQQVSVSADGPDLLVKPDVAARQLETDRQSRGADRKDEEATITPGGGPNAGGGEGGGETIAPPRRQPRRFHVTVELDQPRLGRDAGQIAQEVVQHLSSLVGARVTVTLYIKAEVPEGIPDQAVRTVLEKCRTLRFRSHGFEEA